MEPDLLGPVKVQSYVPFREVGPFVSHRRPYGGTGADNSTGGTHAGYGDTTRAIAFGLTGAETLCPRAPDRGPTPRVPAVPPPSSRHKIPSFCGR